MLRPLTLALVGAALTAAGCLDPGEAGNLVPRTVAEDPSLPVYVLRDGARLHLEVTEAGEGKPLLVVLHGGPGADYKPFRRYVTAFSDRYRVLLFDQRGAGLSERVDQGLDIATYFDDLEELADAFSPDGTLTLVGHSWGGAYAAGFANAYPERVAQLALIDPSPLFGGKEESDVESTVFAFGVPEFNQHVLFDDVASPEDDARRDFRAYQELFADGYPYIEERRFWRVGARASRAMVESLRASGFNFTSNYQRMAQEVLFLSPTGASPFGRALQNLQVGRYSHARLALVTDTNHHSIAYADETLAVLHQFLLEYQP